MQPGSSPESHLLGTPPLATTQSLSSCAIVLSAPPSSTLQRHGTDQQRQSDHAQAAAISRQQSCVIAVLHFKHPPVQPGAHLTSTHTSFRSSSVPAASLAMATLIRVWMEG